MAHDKGKPGTPANDLISLANRQDVLDWCKALGCTEEQLRAAVWKVGNSARQVKEYIAAMKRKG